ncbi:GDP-D-mannose dehydratase [Synechococcus sp. RS9909]|uniref:GDP-mannose 4,6-dehydratase n=1 Tax=unclassified Synechococcus TaxID=2626047 RepID=UPI00032406C2|nr:MULTISPECIES: GDP-mannose 4,6-dehydratase [unclassified Synechococcus]QNI78253.1 GDP-D-mannose dehydratase [Synechococcus sp. RS9909]
MIPPKSALITGFRGQDSTIIISTLLQSGYNITALSRSPSTDPIHSNISLKVINPLAENFRSDLESLFQSHSYDLILHLASANHSSEQPSDAISVLYHSNILYTEYILEFAFKYSPNSKVFIAGSLHQFTNNTEEVIYITTTSKDSPRNPYGLTKCFNRVQAHHYRHLGLDVFFGILFNHESIFHSSSFLLPKLCKHAASINFYNENPESVQCPPNLTIRDIHACVDWSDAQDICSDILSVLLEEMPGEYIFASSYLHSVSNIVNLLTERYCFNFSDYIMLAEPGAFPSGGPITCTSSQLFITRPDPIPGLIDTLYRHYRSSFIL